MAMTLVSRPTENFGPPPGAEPDEVSQYAPRWAREVQARSRKVVPIRLPQAPQLGDPLPEIVYPRNLDTFESDATLQRLLQSPSLAPAPMPPPPLRDSLGLALGMVARLMVAGCAAAGIALLLVGAIPLPFKSLLPAGETTSAATNTWSVASTSDRATKLTARVAEEQRAVAPEVVAPAPSPVTTQTVAAAQAPEPRALEADEVARLVKRGEDYLGQGDIAAARLILARAAEARDGRAAFALGATYDPVVLKQLGVIGFRSDVVLARAWYERAVQYGSPEAARRLSTLPQM